GSPPPATDQVAYTSSDLVHWTYKGVIAKLPKDANRMDVLYNDTTKKYVMFLKYIGNAAFLGISTADAPEGPFTVPPSQTLVDGYSIGDMSAWKDDDGKAYLAYVWDKTGPNRQHAIYRMSADYLTLDTQMHLFDVPSREAPHMFKRNGTYYYGVSETNGIDPSATRYYTATDLAGTWSGATTLVTPGSSTTYETQCDFVFPFTGTDGTVYMLDADRWKPSGNFMGNYVWLPYTFSATGAPTANYYQDWDLNPAAGTWRTFDRSTRDLALGKTATASSSASGAATAVTTATTYQNYTATRWESTASDPQWIMVDLGSAMEVNRVVLKWYSNYGKSFKIQVSTDSTTWTDVFSTTVGASYSVTDEKFAKTTARYVRMNGTQRGNANGYSLFAFMVLNDP
ncbi:MAG TPA: discoidin domain-containing protein, partial [Polyangia bacterium]|nr:discoidin domain-containing protein [Polyangia bacterium]